MNFYLINRYNDNLGTLINLSLSFLFMVSKQNVVAVILILIGAWLTQMKPSQPFTMGLGLGTIVITSTWIVLLIIRDLKKK